MTTKNSGAPGASSSSKTDQKDSKKECKENNKGTTQWTLAGVRRSMSNDMNEDVYMAKSDQ